RMSADATTGSIELSPTEVVYECGSLAAAEATVCVTLYNYEAHILDALESVYDQTLPALGPVVLDDASTDGGPDRVERWMRTAGTRRGGAALVRHARNAGLARAQRRDPRRAVAVRHGARRRQPAPPALRRAAAPQPRGVRLRVRVLDHRA